MRNKKGKERDKKKMIRIFRMKSSVFYLILISDLIQVLFIRSRRVYKENLLISIIIWIDSELHYLFLYRMKLTFTSTWSFLMRWSASNVFFSGITKQVSWERKLLDIFRSIFFIFSNVIVSIFIIIIIYFYKVGNYVCTQEDNNQQNC